MVPRFLQSRVEGKIIEQPIAILIDLGASHSYIAPDLLERFHLKTSKHDKSWLFELPISTKRKISELVKSYPLDMNKLNTFAKLSTIPLGSYDVLIGMEWLDAHHVILIVIIKQLLVLTKKEDRFHLCN